MHACDLSWKRYLRGARLYWCDNLARKAAGQCVARLSAVDLTPARQLLERLWGTEALPGPALAERTQLKAVYTVHPHGRSSTEPVDLELLLPEQLLAAVGKPSLPAWTSGMCIMEYVPLAAAALSEHCGAVAAAWQMRQGFLAALAAGLLRTLEADSITFRSASYMLEVHDLQLLVSVDLPLSFPETAPALSMQLTGAAPQRFSAEALPWSARWTAEEMAQHVVGFLHEQVRALDDSE